MKVVEPHRQLPCKFQMLSLIVTDWDMSSAVYKHVRCLQDRIGEKTKLQLLTVLALIGRLVLPLRHPTEVAGTGLTRKNPHKLRVGRYVTLVEYDAPLGIQSDSQKHSKAISLPLSQLLGILAYGDGV